MRDSLSVVSQRIAAALHPKVDWPALLWSIVPGLGHIRSGVRRIGLIVLAVWLALLVLMVANIGTGLGWFFGTAAIGWHCFVISLLLAVPLSEQPLGTRIQVGFLVYLVLIACMYGPVVLVGRACFRLMPIQGIRSTAVLANGDIVIRSSQWTTRGVYRPGDLVVYRIHGRALQGVVIGEGFGLDRIVGAPGDRVANHGGVLTVNGVTVPAERLPIGGLAGLPEFDFVVGDDEYAILLSTLIWAGQGGDAAQRALAHRMTLDTCRVRERDIVGRAYWRVRPWNRFGGLR